MYAKQARRIAKALHCRRFLFRFSLKNPAESWARKKGHRYTVAELNLKFNSNRCHSRFSFPSFRILMICYHPLPANPLPPSVCAIIAPALFFTLPLLKSFLVQLFIKTVTRPSYHYPHPFHVSTFANSDLQVGVEGQMTSSLMYATHTISIPLYSFFFRCLFFPASPFHPLFCYLSSICSSWGGYGLQYICDYYVGLSARVKFRASFASQDDEGWV